MHIQESEPLLPMYMEASLLKTGWGPLTFAPSKICKAQKKRKKRKKKKTNNAPWIHERYVVLVGNVNKLIRMPFEEVDMLINLFY